MEQSSNKKNKSMLICSFLGSLYTIVLFTYIFTNIFFQSNFILRIIPIFLGIILAPHFIVILIATIFAWISYFTNNPLYTFASAILFSISCLLFFLFAIFIIPMVVLSAVTYSNQSKNILGKQNVIHIPNESEQEIIPTTEVFENKEINLAYKIEDEKIEEGK